ncbi:TetR/AcrR family transcriptional regulator [Sphingorhabdus contaminans]|uniref:TetR/AcrR family transcriptional regulator n=1 Tax=Sphingorhabdus contaminans TaxID=1343899 RepID=UPI003D2A3A72
MKRSAADAAITRGDIIRTARKLFSDKGYAQSTTSEIARGAGVTEGAFFHHFKGKRELFAEVVRQLQREFDRAVSDAAIEAPPGIVRFLAGARASLQLSQKQEYLRIVLIDAPGILGHMQWKEIDTSIALEAIEPALRSLAGNRTVPKTRLRATALSILGLLNESCFALASKDPCVDEVDVLETIEAILNLWITTIQSASA